ncbi:MAG: pyridoxal phosphate-dependent aminotransferase [Planctomycetota bacterium]
MSTLRLSERVSALKPSVTVAVTNRAKQMKRDGVDVLAFAAGEPDFDTPEPVKAAAIEALRGGQTKYMPTLGDPETRGVIADKLVRENGISGVTANHVGISAGGKHSLYLAMHCLLDPAAAGEEPWEVLLPVPAWVSYKPIAELAGGVVKEIQSGPETDFKITPEQLSQAITPRSRVLCLNSPSNPCGTMYTEDELRALAAVVAEKASVAPQLVVLTDEIYEKIVYGGFDHFSIGSVPEIAERTVTINGLSKAFAMTGWRIGYAAMPGEFGAKLIAGMGKLQGQMTTNITSFNYPAIRCALTNTDVAAEVERMRQAFARRGELTHRLLGEIPGVVCPKPTGAFYAFPDISAFFGKTTPGGKTINSSLDLCEAMLEEINVAFVPGEDFGGCGPRHARISFACAEEQIERGLAAFKGFVEKLG